MFTLRTFGHRARKLLQFATGYLRFGHQCPRKRRKTGWAPAAGAQRSIGHCFLSKTQEVKRHLIPCKLAPFAAGGRNLLRDGQQAADQGDSFEFEPVGHSPHERGPEAVPPTDFAAVASSLSLLRGRHTARYLKQGLWHRSR
jgi:hypothetical protein